MNISFIVVFIHQISLLLLKAWMTWICLPQARSPNTKKARQLLPKNLLVRGLNLGNVFGSVIDQIYVSLKFVKSKQRISASPQHSQYIVLHIELFLEASDDSDDDLVQSQQVIDVPSQPGSQRDRQPPGYLEQDMPSIGEWGFLEYNQDLYLVEVTALYPDIEEICVTFYNVWARGDHISFKCETGKPYAQVPRTQYIMKVSPPQKMNRGRFSLNDNDKKSFVCMRETLKPGCFG